MSEKQVVGVVAKNSIAYIEAIFESYAFDRTVVLLRDANDKRVEITGVTKVIEPENKTGWYKKHYTFRQDNSLAQIAFTSGTEGEPKGVLLTHEALSDVTDRLNNIMEVDSSIREYVGIPANFSFGLGRFRAVSAAGGEAFLPDNGFDPLEIRDMLEADEINAVSAVPSLWRVLLKNKQIFGSEAQKLKWIEIGSQYMSRSEKEELKALFPNAKIAQHYGLTEASRSSFLRIDQTQGEHLESVGKAYGKTEFKISDTGRICIRGPHVATTLLKNGEYVSNVDEDGWFHTSDLGRMESEFLYYLGRADDLINCGGTKLSPDALEREIRQALGIKEGIAVAAVDDELTGHAVLVGFLKGSSLDESLLTKAAIDVVTSFGLNNRRAIKLFVIDEFPVTSTNKVKRKELAALYLQHQEATKSQPLLQTSSKSQQPLTEEESRIAAIWCDVLKLAHIDVDSSFYDLGGDSLSAISALIAMESKGVPSNISKGMLQGMTIREIAARLETTTSLSEVHQIRSPVIRNSMTINIVRGLMVLIVIFAHWHQGFFERIPGFDAEGFTAMMGPILAMGTPGFVLIYGVGAGYSLFPLMERDPNRLKSIFFKTSIFLFVGICMLAAVQFWQTIETKVEGITITDFTNSFFSVLTFYLLISATLYFWFKLLKLFKSPIAFSLLLAIMSYGLHLFFFDKFGVLQTEGFFELIKLLFTAKYAYFLMLSGVFIGLATGMWLNQMVKTQTNFSILFIAGPALIFTSIIIWYYNAGMDPWNVWPIREIYLWRWLVYAGVIMLMLAIFERFLINYDKTPKFFRLFLQILSVTGMLAFPLFVLHEMVMPMKAILVTFGLSEILALFLPMAIFFVISYFMLRKLHTVSYQ